MADILRITTPLINKNQQVAPKAAVEPTSPFQLQDINKVMKPFNQKDILQQNNTLLKESDSPEILLDLLKDPGVTVTYLKNIFMLEEIIKLLPANNMALTKEIENLFNELLMPHDEIAQEMMRQEQESTVFKGEFFDFLRKISNESQPRSDIQSAVVNLMKSINNLLIKDDILDAVANSLSYLAKNLRASKGLAEKLQLLALRFRQNDSAGQFASLKGETLAVLKEVGESILFNPQLQKMVSITIYNLSRHNDSMEFFHEAAAALWQKLAGEDRMVFANYVESLMKFFREHQQSRQETAAAEEADAALLAEGGAAGRNALGQAEALNQMLEQAGRQGSAVAADAAGSAAAQENKAAAADTASKVMNALIELVRRQSVDDEAGKGEAGQVDKIIHSLLSSPCNFTPLLHFVVPAFLDDVKAFAEIWVNPYDDDGGAQSVEAGRKIHMLLVIDVEMMGRFEAEVRVFDKVVDLALHCPPGLESRFRGLSQELPAKIRMLHTSYRLGKMEIQTLDHPRSLMEVFKTLPYKRMGMDVKV